MCFEGVRGVMKLRMWRMRKEVMRRSLRRATGFSFCFEGEILTLPRLTTTL